jgi:asparagine synthase (glutamine-hydrolysing)
MVEIFGLIPLQGEPVGEDRLALMAGASGGAGVVWSSGDGFALGQVVPGPGGLPPVPARERQDQVLVAGARLDNRGELLGTFDVPGPERADTADRDLVALACRRWGGQAPGRLHGDWQLALWERATRSLLLARDQWGDGSLYYHLDGRRLAFASELRILLALPDVPKRPDLVTAAARLLAWPGDPFSTFHDGIRTLPPGHLLHLHRGRLEVQRYWRPGGQPTLRLARDADYLEAFLELYQEAVRVRLGDRGPVAATLSGGLDSGSVVALAAPLLRAQGRPFTAFTAVPSLAPAGAGSRRFGDEWPLAEATVDRAGSRAEPIRHVAVDAAESSVLASIERHYAIHLDPGHAAANFHWLHAILERCRDAGIPTLLTGQGGNATVSWRGTGSLLLPLLRGDLRGVAQALGAEGSLAGMLKHQLLGPLALPARRAWRNWTSGGEPWRRYSAIRGAFVREHGILQRMRETGHDPTFTGFPCRDPRMQSFLPALGGIGASWKNLAACHGLEIHDPTRDVRLVEFCLRVPDGQYRHGGQSRLLLRRAMRGRMPDAVLDKPGKGLQAADIGHRIRAEREGILAVLARLEASELTRQILDVARMREVLDDLEGGVNPGNSAACGAILLRGLSVGSALLRF